MTKLSGSEKKVLRGQAQRLKPAINMGEGGLSATFLKELDVVLAKHELIKIRFHRADKGQIKQLCSEIEEQSGCTQVGAVGATASFYKKKEEAKEEKLESKKA